MDFNLDEKKHTRAAYGETLLRLGEVKPNMVVLDADLSSSTKTSMFADKYSNRFFNVGCAEQNLMGMAAGFALEGRTVFASCFAMFGVGRAWEQIRNSIAYDALNVKIVLSHAGLTVGQDGSSHQIIEDLSLMRVIPNMRVMVPADYVETEKMIEYVADVPGPAYIRLSREKTPSIYSDYDPDFAKPQTLIDGSDVTLFSCGLMVAEALKAHEKLSQQEISAEVVNVHTLKPLPGDDIVDSVKKTGAAVTCEEHSIHGGLGGAISEILCENYPTPLKKIGVGDVFGRSGSAQDLMAAYNLTSDDIVEAAKKAVNQKH
ncbi:MAG: transketolase family protein [Candidatus Altiarchaeales archaeon]|nr:transketolase family protein [Candidatus Altiarchaeales archaeon]